MPGIFLDALELVREQVPRARLVFAGGGTEWPQLARGAARFPDGVVTVRGPLPPEELARLLGGAGVALASLRPGQGYDFAMATKALTGLATGTPVVFAGTGPTGEVVAEVDAGMAVRYDAREVAQALVSVVTGPLTSPERTARRVAQRWSARALGGAAARAVLAVLGHR